MHIDIHTYIICVYIHTNVHGTMTTTSIMRYVLRYIGIFELFDTIALVLGIWGHNVSNC